MRGRFAVLALLAACGDDAPAEQPPAVPATPAAAAAKKAIDDKNKLQPRTHVEERVSCAPPEKATGPECKPESASCEPGLYCLSTPPAGFHCEPCPERDIIRHEFHDRDFVGQQVRDPFESFVLIPTGLMEPVEKTETTKACQREDQMVASNYSYQDLKLVGIVAQGTQRKALMMDSGNLGHIVHRGDCVGKEKAVVNDIGTGYLTFRIDSDPNQKVKGPPQETSVQLHPGGLQVPMPGPSDTTPAPPVAPVVAPPAPSKQDLAPGKNVVPAAPATKP